jgi:hypothetical protein
MMPAQANRSPPQTSSKTRRDPQARAVRRTSRWVPVSDLITMTGMSRRWVFYRVRQPAADGYAVQTVRGYWRTAR